jgi:hypothetical protein
MAWKPSTLLVSAILIAGQAASAQNAPSADCPALVLAAFAATGTDQALRNMASGIQAGMAAQTQPGMTVSDRQRMAQAAAGAFGLETIQQNFRSEFVNSCDPELLRGVVARMNSPLAIRMRNLELASRTPDSRRQLDAFVDGLIQTRPPDARLQLIKRLDEAEGYSALLEDSLRAVIRGFTAGSASDVALPKPALDKLRNMMFVAWLFAYRDVGDGELSQYVQLLESPAMKYFTTVFSRTFLGVMTTQSREMGYLLGSNRTAAR